jgi:hypothetical protein
MEAGGRIYGSSSRNWENSGAKNHHRIENGATVGG